jgi:predicted dehydrogenase/nucleoside-diphosphate-sugar epimerase
VSSPAIRVGFVGAGMISDHHAAAVQNLAGVELVGVCDLDAERARARAVAWGTTAYSSLDALVEAGVDVVHVLTPPSTHARVALEALERGCHVLVEKPLAEDMQEARRIGELAAEKGLVATVNHSLLHDPQMLAALEQIRGGALGQVVSVDILRGSEYPPYEGGPLPPHMRSVAYPWRDVGVHCLYVIEELLGRIVDVHAKWLSLGGERNLAFDEWRALVRCERGLGHFALSWNAKPTESQIVVHGTRGVLRVDTFAMFRTKRAGTSLPKAAERVANAYGEALRPLGEVPLNSWRFVSGRLRPYQGVRNFVAEFYRRLAQGLPPPVAVEDAVPVVEWLERVARAAEEDHARRLAGLPRSSTTDVVVTGAAGSVGSAVVRRLLADGRRVRAFVRRVPDEPLEGLEYVVGNLGDPDAVAEGIHGADLVIHAGAAMSGPWPEHHAATVMGTDNVIAACRRFEVRQLVHVSSLSVVDWAGAAGGAPISEHTPHEPRPGERGAYTRAKLEAENAVTSAAAEGLPCVVIRPGVIFGGGIPLIGPSIARRAGGRWVVLGNGRLTVPLVYIDDVVDAIVAAIDRGLVGGEIIQIVDDERLTQTDVLTLAGAAADGAILVPRPVVFGLGKISEYPLGMLGRPSPLALYRLRSAMAQATFASQRAERLLDWRPRVGVREGIRRVTHGDPGLNAQGPAGVS